MEANSTTYPESLKEYIHQLEDVKHRQVISTVAKVARCLFVVTVVVFLGLVIAYNFVFESYEVVGESLECTTNSPFAINYTCKLDIIDSNTQYWSFESALPDGFSLPHMMVGNFLVGEFDD